MDRIKNIIVVTDLTPASEAAVQHAMRIAEWNGASLHLLHVIDEGEAQEAVEQYAVRPAQEVRHQMCERVREKMVAHLPVPVEVGGEGPPAYATVDVTIGDPFTDVLRAVSDVSADLLVLGYNPSAFTETEHTRARRLARKASTKVLLVRSSAVRPFRRVVACVDFAELSEPVIRQAARVARQEQAELHVIHLPAPTRRLLDLLDFAGDVQRDREGANQHRLDNRLDRLLSQVQDELEGLKVTKRVVHADGIVSGITDYLQSDGTTLGVVGSRGRLNLRGILMGSTAERLIDAAPCALLMIKPSDFHYDLR